MPVVEIPRNGSGFFPANGVDVAFLPRQIDCIGRIDLHLPGDLPVEVSELRPDRRKPVQIDIRIGQQIIGAATHPVLIDFQAAGNSLAGRKGERLQFRAARFQGRFPRIERRPAPCPDTAGFHTHRRQPLIGVVGPKAEPVFGP